MSKNKQLNEEKLKYIQNFDCEYIIGIDECGAGSFAGPICVCAFRAPKSFVIESLTDSKELSKIERESFDIKIRNECVGSEFAYSIHFVHPNNKNEFDIYGTNLHSALKSLYWKTVNDIWKENSLIVLDGVIKFPEIPNRIGPSVSLPKADLLIQQVSAASILGKVSRDALMTEKHNNYPHYKWDKNAGYGTPDHIAAINEFGICDEHRYDFAPIKKFLEK